MRCRPCLPGDAPAAVDLLCQGFPDRDRAYWTRALDRLSRHVGRVGAASFGQVFEVRNRVVGVLLTIPSRDARTGRSRRNVSSWYVEPAYRAYAPMLLSRSERDPEATFFNISPATHTRPIIEAQGFARYGTGRFWAFPWLARPRRARVTGLATSEAVAAHVGEAEGALLLDHLAWGCLAVAVEADGDTEPFVFLPRLTKGVVPSAQLVYCRDVGRFAGLAGPLGRWLLRRGFPLVAIDSDGRVPGLAGVFAPDAVPKYFKGPVMPRLGDLSYTELVMFGP